MRGLGDEETEGEQMNPLHLPTAEAGARPQPSPGAPDPLTASERALSLTHTLREAARHGERAVLLCSFQKEESVLLDELLQLDQGTADAVRIVTIDTGVLFAETLQTWRAFEERFGVKIEVQDASNPEHAVERARALLLGRQGRGAGARARRRRRLDHGHPPRAGSDACRDPADRTRRASAACGSTTRSPTGPTRTCGGASTSATCPTTRSTTAATSRSAARRARSPAADATGRWAGTDKTECGLHAETVE